jgi:alkanesulfonate monooxygenase SsuD/methylene tetrahydromethanopterin reductase-like flavin-dependent oxidoreductase (luciferase family)
MTAVGVPMAGRGARTDEYLDAMRALWSDPEPAYHGRHVSFGGIDAHPRPVRTGGPRVIIGGASPAAYRRAVTRGHGFYGNGQHPGDLARHLAGLEQAAARAERPPRLGPLEISFLTLAPDVDYDTAQRYAELGADRLVLYPPAGDVAQAEAFLRRHAGQLRLTAVTTVRSDY